MYIYVRACRHTKKSEEKKGEKKTRPTRSHIFIYEEGKEKEKMFFFSALHVVVHFEKAISEPAINYTQKEKKREQEMLLVHKLREEKRE